MSETQRTYTKWPRGALWRSLNKKKGSTFSCRMLSRRRGVFAAFDLHHSMEPSPPPPPATPAAATDEGEVKRTWHIMTKQLCATFTLIQCATFSGGCNEEEWLCCPAWQSCKAGGVKAGSGQGRDGGRPCRSVNSVNRLCGPASAQNQVLLTQVAYCVAFRRCVYCYFVAMTSQFRCPRGCRSLPFACVPFAGSQRGSALSRTP